jgi:hypothetical protein
MGKTFKDNKVRNWHAVNSWSRSSAGPMKNRRDKRKSNRPEQYESETLENIKEENELEHLYDRDDEDENL